METFTNRPAYHQPPVFHQLETQPVGQVSSGGRQQHGKKLHPHKGVVAFHFDLKRPFRRVPEVDFATSPVRAILTLMVLPLWVSFAGNSSFCIPEGSGLLLHRLSRRYIAGAGGA